MLYPYPTVGSLPKAPSEIKWVSLNWKPAYPSLAIVSSTWEAAGGLFIDTDGVTGQVTRALVSGGAKGVPAYVDNTITLADGEVRLARVQIEVT
jgi:hypothetical protein